MKRYSNLYGTIYANANSNVAVYASVGSSQQLPAFLNEIGATNAQLTVDTVRNILAGFPNSEEYKAHYATQPANDLPVSVRYAPMHLRNHPDMPSTIKPFTAIGVSGNENKRDEGDTRYSTYVQTLYIGREHMHEAVTEKVHGTQKTYNYLDQIFGTHLLGHRELSLVRANKIRMDYDALPSRVEPVMQAQDRPVVYNTVDAVFDNKAVIIRLEKGCGFNSRAWQLLVPIYALMPPRLATEIGFATYLNPSEIQKLVADTSMRIFVLPAECELKGLDTSDMLVMDLNAPVRGTAGEEMGKLLNRWSKMPWDKRQVAMEKVFADTAATFNDKALFIQRSNEFLDQAEAWEKGVWLEKGAFTTLEELKAKYESLPLCAQIPWMKEGFIARVPLMMKEKGAIHKLTGQALAAWRIGKDESAKEIYEFGLSMGGTNTRAMADTARELTEKLAAPMLAEAREETRKAIADGEAAVARTKAEGEAAVAAANAAGAAAVAAEQEKTAKAIADGEAAVAAATAAGAAATAQAKAEGEAALEQLKKVAAEKIKTERDAHAATQQQLAAETEAHTATKQQLTTVSQECETVKAERDGLNQRLEKAKTAYTELKKAKAEVDQQLAGVDAKAAEAQQLAENAKALIAETEAAKAKADKVIKENNKRMIIFAAAGFLVAALIFGVILLVMGLGKDEPVEETTLPTETVEVTEATEEVTEAPTEEPTEAPTEAPTEPTEPDLTVWTDDAAALWLEEQVEGIAIEANPLEIPQDLAMLEGYQVVAALRTAESEDEAGAYLLQKSEEILTEDERVLMENETKPDEGEEPTEEPTEPEAAELTALEIQDALAVLTSEEFVLVVYGEETLGKALEVYGLMVAQEQEVLTRWALADAALDIDEAMAGFLFHNQWWRGLMAVNQDAEVLTAAMETIGVKEIPVAELAFEGKSFYLFAAENENLAEALDEELLHAGHNSVAVGTLVILEPMVQE